MADGLFDATIQALDLRQRFDQARFQAQAQNIANVNTPSYKALTVDNKPFQEVLQQVLSSEQGGGQASSYRIPPHQVDPPFFSSSPALSFNPEKDFIPREGIDSFRLDGSTVDIEKETVRMIKTSVLFNSVTDLLRAKFNMLQTAIQERVV